MCSSHCRVGLDGGDLASLNFTPHSKQKLAKMYASPLSRPLPPPLSTLPRSSNEFSQTGDVPPPLPPRQTPAAEEGAGTVADGSASTAASFISFLTGIGRKRQHSSQAVSAAGSSDLPGTGSGAEEVLPARGEETMGESALSGQQQQQYDVLVEVGERGHFVKIISQADVVSPCCSWSVGLSVTA